MKSLQGKEFEEWKNGNEGHSIDDTLKEEYIKDFYINQKQTVNMTLSINKLDMEMDKNKKKNFGVKSAHLEWLSTYILG